MCVGDKAVICHKVGLKDFFFIGKGVGKDYMKYFGKIAKKHVDFLFCHERDLFVEKVYKDAKKPTDQHIAIAIYYSIRTFGRTCSFVYYMKYLLI